MGGGIRPQILVKKSTTFIFFSISIHKALNLSVLSYLGVYKGRRQADFVNKHLLRDK